MHIEYDAFFVMLSIIVAIAVSFFAFSVENLSYYKKNKQYALPIIFISGLLFGLAIWVMHFVGMLACHLPHGYQIDPLFTMISYVIAAVISIFAVWLKTRSTLPASRLLLGSVFMGLGISAMHYTGMEGLIFADYELLYDPMMVFLSVFVAICGTGLAYYLSCNFKKLQDDRISPRLCVATVMGCAIAAMHYTGMASVYFVPAEQMSAFAIHQSNHPYFLVAMLLLFILITIVGIGFAIFEQQIKAKGADIARLNFELSSVNRVDQLTKLPNRSYLEEYMHHVLPMSSSQHVELSEYEHAFALFYIDLDRFRLINDFYGYAFGDELLKRVAERIQQTMRQNASLIRFESDELVMIVPNVDADEAGLLARQINSRMKQPLQIDEQLVNVSTSIGVALFPEHAQNNKDLILHANLAMLQAKAQGRNTYCVFDRSMQANLIRDEYKLLNDLSTAIAYNELYLQYQPKFLPNGQIHSLEALLRWRHPQLGLVEPMTFIPLAEKSGLIVGLGYWVLKQVCRQLKQWREEGRPVYPIAVNFSATQFEQADLFDVLQGLIDNYQIQAADLIIEATESTTMHNLELCIQCFERLRELGIQVAIDDFGTGYSSFAHLKDLPIDELKIDKVFIQNLHAHSKEETILSSIIDLARNLGLSVTAEGVETREQAQVLARLGCHQLQGFYFAKPMSIFELEQTQFQQQAI